MLDVICVGSVTFDTIAIVPQVPGDDERILSDIVLGAGGSPATTAAVTLARLGARVGFCGVVGDDQSGAIVRDELEREGVVTDWLTVSPQTRTAQSCVLVSAETSGRTIVTSRAPAPLPADVPISQSTWLHVDQTGFLPVRAALSALGNGADRPLLSVDAGNPIDTADLAGVELYAPSVPALLSLYPLGVAEAMDDGAAAVVATDGSRRTYVLHAGEVHLVEAFSVPVLSTLGAGDVFHGALLAGLIAVRPLLLAIREANAVAALSCRGLDGRSAIAGIAGIAELEEFLAFAGSQSLTSSSTERKAI